MEVIFKQEAKNKLIKGISKVSEAVGSTLGPYGRNVVFVDEYGTVRSTKDGVTVAKTLKNFKDPFEDIGAQLIKQTSIKTAEKVGDGTTTSTVLAENIIKESFNNIKSNTNVVALKKGLEEASKEVISKLKEISKSISSEDQLTQVASLSANNDEELGKLVSTAMNLVGRDGIVAVEESKTGETSLETVEGIKFDRGYKSMYFVTDNNSMSAVLTNPKILIYNGRMTQVKELVPILESLSMTDSSLLIIADDIDGEALSTLIVNKMRGILKVIAVKSPDFGDRKLAILEDIATVTGGTVVSPEKGMRIEKFDPSWLGGCHKVITTKEDTTIIEGKGKEESIQNRIKEIKDQIHNSLSSFEKEHLQERLGKLVGGVAVINIGGVTETEIKEKKDRIEDALQATKAALEEGLLPGGGVALLNARGNIIIPSESNDFSLGKKILYKSCEVPFLRILENAGEENISDILVNLKISSDSQGKDKNSWGYDIKNRTFANMFSSGIIDPMKVVRIALENAVSVAGTILLTECVIADDKKEEKSENNEML